MQTTIIEMSNLDSIKLVQDEGNNYVRVLLVNRVEPIIIDEDDEAYASYEAIAVNQRERLEQYVINLVGKDKD